MQKWEYDTALIGSDELERKPNKLTKRGTEGWELVAVVPAKVNVPLYNFFFKRALEELKPAPKKGTVKIL